MLKIYVCGPTVYNDVHIGNLRPIITMDLILKAARALGISFKFVHNITDIDDKIIQKSLETKTSETEVANLYSRRYLEILNKFNVDTITDLEYVTKNIDKINDFIQRLHDNNDAYIDLEKNLWFNVEKYKDKYGSVSNQKLEFMIFEDTNYNKNFPADFALWKNTNQGIKFDSFLGSGRPGWHTECAALIFKHFQDDKLDLHGGGMDLTFPHHENENIQYYAITKKDITTKWLRTGQINLNGIKMSKSLQNVFLASDFITQYEPDIFKLIILLNNVTSLINIDENVFNNSNKILRKIKNIYFLAHLSSVAMNHKNNELATKAFQDLFDRKFSDFMKTINDLIKKINTEKRHEDIATLVYIFDSLGFDFKNEDYPKYVQIYQNWQMDLKNKDYLAADAKRELLMNKKLI
ncbi:hypothetical protein [Mycoplasmopsis glycophila]|uniref:hypothetical protein n=1 Tax=Mycoplasmopsis glycophila TaxID=171285 RepID=UPI000483AFB2|nr:hypothetical protein [Mycoplasmopsis glycophila]